MLDLSNLNPETQPAAAEALAGTWEAVILDSGDVTTINDVIDNSFSDVVDTVRIVIVRDDALPVHVDDTGIRRLPTVYPSAALAAEFDNLEGIDDVVRTWVRAVAMAEGLNAALEPEHDCNDTVALAHMMEMAERGDSL